jgi:hypothetical protein
MPTYKAQVEKARQTDETVAGILEMEREARKRKTAKLRALRLAKGDDRPAPISGTPIHAEEGEDPQP